MKTPMYRVTQHVDFVDYLGVFPRVGKEKIDIQLFDDVAKLALWFGRSHKLSVCLQQKSQTFSLFTAEVTNFQFVYSRMEKMAISDSMPIMH